MSCCIILGSSNPRGNTYHVVQKMFSPLPDLYCLSDYKIGHYDYQGKNETDDFLPLIKKLLLYSVWIFATPVYWYSMSGLLKVFFDRFTDLISCHKEIVNNLKGKTTFLVCTSSSGKPETFESPIAETFSYLGMVYDGCCDLIGEAHPQSVEHNPVQLSKGQDWFAKQQCHNT